MSNSSAQFLGNYTVSIDSKQRVAMPKPLRETLATGFASEKDQVIVTLATDLPAIAVFPVSSFDELTAQLRRPGELATEPQSLLGLLTGCARRCPIDGQGRIRLPEDLLGDAGLIDAGKKIKKEAVFHGFSNRILIWDVERYREYTRELKANRAEIARRAFEASRNS